MSPTTHFLASWVIAAKTTDNPRDCRLVTLAGILPDLDGLGMVVDIVNNLQGTTPLIITIMLVITTTCCMAHLAR